MIKLIELNDKECYKKDVTVEDDRNRQFYAVIP